jgi:hypothetical protein
LWCTTSSRHATFLGSARASHLNDAFCCQSWMFLAIQRPYKIFLCMGHASCKYFMYPYVYCCLFSILPAMYPYPRPLSSSSFTGRYLQHIRAPRCVSEDGAQTYYTAVRQWRRVGSESHFCLGAQDALTNLCGRSMNISHLSISMAAAKKHVPVAEKSLASRDTTIPLRSLLLCRRLNF